MDGGAEESREGKLVREIAETLKKIDQTGIVPADISDNPGVFLRELYEAWHHNGGLVSGRYRNSVRHMRKEWLTGANLVRALHAKLVGRVKTTRDDAECLVDLFLSRWKFVGQSGANPTVTNDGYTAFPAKDLKKLRRLLVVAIFPDGTEQSKSGILLPRQDDEPLDYAGDEVKQILEQSHALIVVSRHRTVVGPTQPAAMLAAWHQLNKFYAQDQRNTGLHRNIIWIVDAGSSLVEDELSFHLYYNVGFLALLFRMFKRFNTTSDMDISDDDSFAQKLLIGDSEERERRWTWLNRVGTVLISNLEREDFTNFYNEQEKKQGNLRLKDGDVKAEQLLPTIVPPSWAKILRKHYGSRSDRAIDDVALTIFYKDNGWDNSAQKCLYFLHEEVKGGAPSIEQDIEWGVHSIRLAKPDGAYDQAYEMAILASKYRLEKKDKDDKRFDDKAISFAYLRKMGFQVLKVDEFVSIF